MNNFEKFKQDLTVERLTSDEKITDSINYLLLLSALVREENNERD